MKVRHKKTGVELEVRNSRAVDPAGFYITKGESWINKKDPDWELALEEEWENVTHEYKIFFPIIPGASIAIREDERLSYIDGLHNGPAFIVERRKAQ